MKLKSFLVLLVILPQTLAACSTGNMNPAADAQIDPSEEKLADPSSSDDQQATATGTISDRRFRQFVKLHMEAWRRQPPH